MKSALLFAGAHQTYFVRSAVETFLASLDCSLAAEEAAFGASFLPPLSRLLAGHDVVFVISPAEGFTPARPACAKALFERLHVPLGADGEPRGVLRLADGDIEGYLLESSSQAICLLPDDARLLPRLLAQAAAPLCEKYGLTRRAAPATPTPRFEEELAAEQGPEQP